MMVKLPRNQPPEPSGIPGAAWGFNLLEIIVVVAVIATLAALLLPALGRARAKGRRAVCMSNLQQICAGVRMYADDSSDAFPPSTNMPPASFTAYTQLMKSYLGLRGAEPEKAEIFSCPADTFSYDFFDNVTTAMHLEPRFYYSSYGFNGGNFLVGTPPAARWPGIAGRKLSSIKQPSKTVLVGEFSAFYPFSWHEPGGPAHYNNALDMVGFVDGHVSFIKIYWDAAVAKDHIEAWQYDPPEGYDYKWSGD